VLFLGTDRALNRIVFTKEYAIRSINSLERQDGFKDVENSPNATFNDKGNTIWFGTTKGLTLYLPAHDKTNLLRPLIKITSVKINGSPFPVSSLSALSSTQNSIRVDFVSISLTSPPNNKYYYKLAGLDSSWNRVIIDRQNNDAFASVEYKKLPPGTYTLLIRAYNNNGIVSPDAEVRFTIALPFYKTTAFISTAIIALFLLFYLLLKFREQALVKEKVKLESIVKERTAEVVLQKNEIENQKKEITDSINYSKRIQNAILPEQEILFENMPGSFILYMPKDIVSGDFYYFLREGNCFYMAVADCTGHGVPGAFMSMIGSKAMEEAVLAGGGPGQILGRLNKNIRKTLKQHAEHGIRDGMDIALLSFALSPTKKVEGISYSAANRPLWIIRNNSEEIEEVKATKSAIGGHTEDKQKFAQHDIAVGPGDQLYIFSDGYADQFGGNAGKKIMTKKMKELLLECCRKPMNEQKEYLERFFSEWRGGHHEQVDDVLIIGVRC
jgi:serine phosphatase RsbU (regulator of sigma subunit)